MAKGQRDLYQVWKDNGEFDTIVAFIKDCYKKLVTQREMCEYLHISEVTLSRMKKKHPDIAALEEALVHSDGTIEFRFYSGVSVTEKII